LDWISLSTSQKKAKGKSRWMNRIAGAMMKG